MAQEWILKQLDRGLDSGCSGTSLKNKLGQLQHRQDLRDITVQIVWRHHQNNKTPCPWMQEACPEKV